MNGRVNINYPDTNKLFAMYDRISCDSRVTEYRDALTGNWSENELSRRFFGKDNIQLLQTKIIEGVFNMSKGRYTIGNQCTDTLKIIMRSTFLSYAKNQCHDFNIQITELNQIILDYCIPQVYAEAKGYFKYLHDISTLVTPIDHPVMTNDGDSKSDSLQPNIGF
jgi:hypothetical protein